MLKFVSVCFTNLECELYLALLGFRVPLIYISNINPILDLKLKI